MWKEGEKGRMEEGDRNEMPHVCICALVIAYYLQTANSDCITGCRYSIPYLHT